MAVDAGKIARKYARVTPTRREDYAEGVAAPSKDWLSSYMGAEKAMHDGLTKAMTERRLVGGAKKAGTMKWQANTIKKGVEQDRWGNGVAIAGPAFEAGFAPYADVINQTVKVLPPRREKGNPDNIKRVAVMSKAMYDKKVETLKRLVGGA